MRGVTIALGEIAFFIGLAGLIGLAIGWVLRDWAFANRAEELDEQIRADRAAFRAREAAADARERDLRAAIAERDALLEEMGRSGSGSFTLSDRPLPAGSVMQPGGFGSPFSAVDGGGSVRLTSDAVLPSDDLEQLRGVGPTLARRMNEFGITTFGQLAQLDDDAVGTLADAIRVSRGRIERDDWVGHAARLATKGATGS